MTDPKARQYFVTTARLATEAIDALDQGDTQTVLDLIEDIEYEMRLARVDTLNP